MTQSALPAAGARRSRTLGALAVTGIIGLYYALFFFPPRLVGSNDPDRFYHLGLSRLIAEQGVLRTLPQVEDLGWGQYFPDKEFLFHALTGGAYWLGGPLGSLLVVPILGIAIVLSMYAPLARVIAPSRAAILVTAACLLSPVLIFRMTMLRPHLLAILCVLLLVAAFLRLRPWLALVACATFAMAYHAFYIPVIVVGVAAMVTWPDRSAAWRCCGLAIAGLLVGTVLNPYFPSNAVMSWIHLKIALGIGLPPALRLGTELTPITAVDYLQLFGFPLASLVATAALAYRRRLRATPENAGLWFLFGLTLVLVLLSMKSSRAIEYSVPCSALLAGYCLSYLAGRKWFAAACACLVATQGFVSSVYYRDIWDQPQGGNTGDYLAAVALLPPEAAGRKVFNCEWSAGSYLLFARPDVRFVDLLEPSFLWHRSPGLYVARERLLSGVDPDPVRSLRRDFHADYVLCGISALNARLLADPVHFEPVPGSGDPGELLVMKVKE